MKNKALVFLFALLSTACASATPHAKERQPSSFGPNEFAAQKLRAKGMPEDFLQLVLQNFHEDEREKVLELNVLGFLRANKATGEETIPSWELKRVRKFLQLHKRIFFEAEKKFRVEKEVIASLLWVETKHGKDLGTFHVASALFSIVQGEYPTLLDQLLDSARRKAADYDKLMEAKIQERARLKSDWAAGELLALQEIHQRGWKDAAKLHGSFSGAFGMAQFMPSSYLIWAKGKKQRPNLFRADDSIFSVANYLSANGWEWKSRKAQESALFHYNRDRSYVAHILRMSECLRKPDKITGKWKRRTASVRGDC